MNRVLKLLATTVAIMALPTPALAVAVKPPVVESAQRMTVEGAMEFDGSVNGGSYRVGEYLLIYKNPDELSELLGKEVLIQGRVVKEPTIHMRPTLEVEVLVVKGLPHQDDDVSIMPVPTLPDNGHVVSPNPGTGSNGGTKPQPNPDEVTIQPYPYPQPTVEEPITIQPHPYPMPIVDEPVTIQPYPYPMPIVDDTVTILPYPMPVVGTPYVALYGTVELQDGAIHLTEWTPGGTVCWQLYSDQIDLKLWLGQRVALMATPEKVAGGHHLYRVEKLVSTSMDLANLIDAGEAVLYHRPATKVSVLLKGEPIALDQAPVFGNGRTLVPLRAIAEATGAHVHWDEKHQVVTVTLSQRQVLVRLGSNIVIIRESGQPDQVVLNDTAPVLVGGRTMVPARIISEGLGLSVSWDPNTFTVSLQ